MERLEYHPSFRNKANAKGEQVITLKGMMVNLVEKLLGGPLDPTRGTKEYLAKHGLN